MRCDGCTKWTTARVTRYGDGSEVVNWKAPDGKGRCALLGLDTAEAFGCTGFDAVPAGTVVALGDHSIKRDWKNGAPWQHSVAGPCPDCRGTAENGICRRCAGTGKVRYYDDGFIGEEQTRLHPRELEQVGPLKCRNCAEVVDIRWKACPMCGTKLEPPAETEQVDGLGNAGGDFRNDARAKRAIDLRTDIDAMNANNDKITSLRRVTVDNGCTEDEAAAAAGMADKLEAMAR